MKINYFVSKETNVNTAQFLSNNSLKIVPKEHWYLRLKSAALNLQNHFKTLEKLESK